MTQRLIPEHPSPVGGRLGRHQNHDPRSRNYAYSRTVTALRSVRYRRHVAVYDQGDLGSCTGNACAGALSTHPFTHRFTETRARKIYSEASALDPWPGQWPPDDTGSDGLSVAKVAVNHGWISRYEHCFSADDVFAALQHGPVLLGISWRSTFDQPATDGRMPFGGTVRGGHEIYVDELDVERQRVWVQNSWSDGWAVKGRAYWTWDDFRQVLADDGDATVLVP